ncbi:HET-domain-containing protein, partial [Hyaloscypha hepaticicola]
MSLQSQERELLLYEPLLTSSRQLRLLILNPCTNPKEAIRCTLVKISLDSPPKYEALSYTWGEPVDDFEIIVNSVTFAVRRNLWEALYHLRGGNSRALWIDAVCINQNNISERNEQVQMMRRIYERAQRVVIWLG